MNRMIDGNDATEALFEKLCCEHKDYIGQCCEWALHDAPGDFFEWDDVYQEIRLYLWRHFDSIFNADEPIAMLKTLAKRRSRRCIKWIAPQLPEAPESRKGDKTVYENDGERSLTGHQAVEYVWSQEQGIHFDIEDY